VTSERCRRSFASFRFEGGQIVELTDTTSDLDVCNANSS
jgi:hypothetical protein